MGSGPQVVFNENTSAVTATKSTGLNVGTLRYEGDRVYEYIYNPSVTAAAITLGMCDTASSTSGYSLTASTTTGYSICRGLVVDAIISASCYGWLMKRGVATFEAGANNSFAVGQGMMLGTLGVMQPATTVSLTGAHNVFGYAISALASGGSGLGYFNCL